MYQLGKKFVNEGVWVEFGGAQFLIAQAGNPSFTADFERLKRRHRKAIDRGTFPDSAMRDLVTEAVSTGVLLDWKGVGEMNKDGKMKEVKYTPEVGLQQLKDDPELLEFVLDTAANAEEYRLKANEEAEGKS